MFTSIEMVSCPVCGDKTRVRCTDRKRYDHVRRYRLCKGKGCGYSFITAQTDGSEQITDPMKYAYLGAQSSQQKLVQAIK